MKCKQIHFKIISGNFVTLNFDLILQKLNVLFKDECDRVVELSFLNVDSITQVKTKILDYFSQGRFAQLQHTPEQFDLGR